MSKVIRLETGEERSSSTVSNGLFDVKPAIGDVIPRSKTLVFRNVHQNVEDKKNSVGFFVVSSRLFPDSHTRLP